MSVCGRRCQANFPLARANARRCPENLHPLAFPNAYGNFQSDLKKRPTAQNEIHHREPEAGKEGLSTRLMCRKPGHRYFSALALSNKASEPHLGFRSLPVFIPADQDRRRCLSRVPHAAPQALPQPHFFATCARYVRFRINSFCFPVRLRRRQFEYNLAWPLLFSRLPTARMWQVVGGVWGGSQPTSYDMPSTSFVINNVPGSCS